MENNLGSFQSVKNPALAEPFFRRLVKGVAHHAKHRFFAQRWGCPGNDAEHLQHRKDTCASLASAPPPAFAPPLLFLLGKHVGRCDGYGFSVEELDCGFPPPVVHPVFFFESFAAPA